MIRFECAQLSGCTSSAEKLFIICKSGKSAELVGAKPLHLLTQTALPLKSPTGAFIATQTRIFPIYFFTGGVWNKLPQSKPDGFAGSLGEGAFGMTGYFAAQAESPPAKCVLFWFSFAIKREPPSPASSASPATLPYSVYIERNFYLPNYCLFLESIVYLSR